MMDYKILIVQLSPNDENVIFNQVRTWISTTSQNVYVLARWLNLGFKYAMLERASNLVFIDNLENTFSQDDNIILLRPDDYLDFDRIQLLDISNHPRLFRGSKLLSLSENINNLGIQLRRCEQAPIETLSPNGLLNYHAYNKYWDVYKFLSTTLNGGESIPNFPLYTKSIKITNLSYLPDVIRTFINEPPLTRTLWLPSHTILDILLTKIGYHVTYDDCECDVLISDSYEGGYKAVFIKGSLNSKMIPMSYEYIFAKGWSCVKLKDYHQRRVDLPGYFNEVSMIQLRIAELYDHFDLFLIGQMDTPYSSNEQIEQGYPNIHDPDGKVRLLKLCYPDEVKKLNDPWVKDRYYRQYSVYHPDITDYDLLFVLDLDEIPDTKTINKECNWFTKSVKRLEMEMHYYNFDWVKRYKWYHGYFGYVEEVRKYGADRIRVNSPVNYPIVQKGGWHISYALSPELIQKKIQSFAHQEWNKYPYTDLDHIRNCIKQGFDLFLRPNENMVKADPEYRPMNHALLQL